MAVRLVWLTRLQQISADPRAARIRHTQPVRDSLSLTAQPVRYDTQPVQHAVQHVPFHPARVQSRTHDGSHVHKSRDTCTAGAMTAGRPGPKLSRWALAGSRGRARLRRAASRCVPSQCWVGADPDCYRLTSPRRPRRCSCRMPVRGRDRRAYPQQSVLAG